jgi:hypothetical protein
VLLLLLLLLLLPPFKIEACRESRSFLLIHMKDVQPHFKAIHIVADLNSSSSDVLRTYEERNKFK